MSVSGKDKFDFFTPNLIFLPVRKETTYGTLAHVTYRLIDHN